MGKKPIKDLMPLDAGNVAMARTMKGACIHLPARAIHRTIKVRDSLRVMDLCEGCYGVLERAGCIAEVLL